MKVGLLNPGLMGTSIGAAARATGNDVLWASFGRSDATAARASDHGFIDLKSLAALAEQSELIISVCPPEFAEPVASSIAECSYAGRYLDANAISPVRASRIGKLVGSSGATFVDGGIIGPPIWQSDTTWLALSGPEAGEVADIFDGSKLNCKLLGDEIGRASALKMVFAAYTKGRTALICGILATADVYGIRRELTEQWRSMGMGLDKEAPSQTRSVTAKAWRFAAEMEEIASTFEQAGLPGGFHEAAAEIYRSMAEFKDAESTPELEDVLAALAGGKRSHAA
jgi:3-hydroxyisobutyrate dehydrogenase-like beta-hydroxyacid dehydrogenase